MRVLRRHGFAAILGCALAAAAPPVRAQAPAPAPTPAPPPFSWTFEARLRGEAFATPAVTGRENDRYELLLGRVRAGADWRLGSFTFHGAVQGAAAHGLPAGAIFGTGAAYRTASGDDSEVGTLGLLEATAAFRTPEVALVVGRQPWSEGAEALPGVPYLDAVKRGRIAERLIGNWEWVNVGRRFDGASASWQSDALHLSGFAFHPTAGGVDHDDALERLADLRVAGVSATARYGRWLPSAEARAFLFLYDDERPGARSAAAGDIDLRTAGGHLLWGGESWDAFVWAAVQRGDWGRTDHAASAVIVEVGRQLGGVAGKPALRLGAARASGDEAAGDHGTFVPLLPTKHKFLGSLDYVTFANLETAYLDARWSLPAKWALQAGLHTFRLADRRDAWYTGSGAFDEQRLGYTLRRPARGGNYPSTHLGEELDVEASRPLVHGLSLAVGAGWFRGGGAAEAAFPDDPDGAWGWAQLSWRRP